MASTLLRTSALRGSALLRAVSAAAADAPSGGKRLPAPLRRVSSHSGSSGVEPPSASSSGVGPLSHDEKVKLLNQRINELNSKVEKRYVLYASLQKLVEEKKMRNPFAEWSWQVGVVGLIVLATGWMGSEKQDN